MIGVVIRLTEKDYEDLIQAGENTINLGLLLDLKMSVKKGVVLPKGHGRLGDLDKIADRLEVLRDGWNYYGNEYESGMYKGYDHSLDEVMDAPAIIEADKAGDEVEE